MTRKDVWYGTGEVKHMVGYLRWAANKNSKLAVGDYWALCDETADMIESMLLHEQSYGLRKTLTHELQRHHGATVGVKRGMTRGDVIRMARKAGYGMSLSVLHVYALERFAALVAAAEREECAKECELLGAEPPIEGKRAKLWRIASKWCAAAIRARREEGERNDRPTRPIEDCDFRPIQRGEQPVQAGLEDGSRAAQRAHFTASNGAGG